MCIRLCAYMCTSTNWKNVCSKGLPRYRSWRPHVQSPTGHMIPRFSPHILCDPLTLHRQDARIACSKCGLLFSQFLISIVKTLIISDLGWDYGQKERGNRKSHAGELKYLKIVLCCVSLHVRPSWAASIYLKVDVLYLLLRLMLATMNLSDWLHCSRR